MTRRRRRWRVIPDYETAQMCDLLKSKVESLDFLKKLNGVQKSVYQDVQLKRRKVESGRPGMGTKVIYNVASWGATAVGVYNNRALLTVTSTAFRTSCRVVSKFL
ncbi:hypothetical protein HU200_037788 [Digitaria exilis]|uniref:Uncharacterized protein n=1 Tax=Digitaria exilis TaxID=1010633 RepID=A0A835BE35_9POAL|nr:hypothetical protein HU200_037788 [Digitaria exilis]